MVLGGTLPWPVPLYGSLPDFARVIFQGQPVRNIPASVTYTAPVLTGSTAAEDVDRYPYRPSRIVDSIADLVGELH